MKDCKKCVNYQNNSCITGIWQCDNGEDRDCLEYVTDKMNNDFLIRNHTKREIDLLQDLLYDAKMGELSVYENGDQLINDIPDNAKQYVKNNLISIPDGCLLLVDDANELDPILGAQQVYDFYEDMNIFDCAWHPNDVKTVCEYLKTKYHVKVREV